MAERHEAARERVRAMIKQDCAEALIELQALREETATDMMLTPEQRVVVMARIETHVQEIRDEEALAMVLLAEDIVAIGRLADTLANNDPPEGETNG